MCNAGKGTFNDHGVNSRVYAIEILEQSVHFNDGQLVQMNVKRKFRINIDPELYLYLSRCFIGGVS